jgi:hypothetical protein
VAVLDQDAPALLNLANVEKIVNVVMSVLVEAIAGVNKNILRTF